ncbi:MAG: succinate dehydrogenase, hydrophobic membrane anchor protein [Hyphomonadaceae bacterium]
MSASPNARGHGTGHFIAQRGTAIALALLASWFTIAAALSMPDAGYGSAVEFLTPPMNAVGVMLLVAAGLYHMAIGMDEIIADYIAKPSTRRTLSFLNNAFAFVLGAAGLFAVLRVSFGV